MRGRGQGRGVALLALALAAAGCGRSPAPQQPGAEQAQPPRAPTARASVSVLSDSFAMPQLGRRRTVRLYLPPGYSRTQKRYPVLYMHDGQNLFDDATSYAGEWGVDETLDSLHAAGDPGVIVVAVDNGGDHRLDEYSPWRNPRISAGGEGDAYVDFLARTLKPYVDTHYRTRPDRLSTGIMGSSMGGLISLYAALKHSDVFGRAGVFSPSLWFSPAVYDAARAARPRPGTRLYFLMGGREGDNPQGAVQSQARMVAVLTGSGFQPGTQLQAVVRPEGTHSEGFWRREFPAAYRWLFGGAEATPAPAAPVSPVPKP